MPTIVTVLLGLLAGGALGGVYFGGLWWTVRDLGEAQRPGLRLMVSFGVRAVFALVGFAALVVWSAWALVGGLVGFVVVRMVMARWVGDLVTNLEESSLWN